LQISGNDPSVRKPRYLTLSRGMARIPFLETLLSAQVVWRPKWISGLRGLGGCLPSDIDAIVGWGRRPGTERARQLALRLRIPYIAIEDGLLRSYGTGERFPPLSIVVDPVGIYYDSDRPSALENLLNASEDVLAGVEAETANACVSIIESGLSKYNHSPAFTLPDSEGVKRILVVDQTMDDMSVVCGGADANTFVQMLQAARAEHPEALIYVKTHPEVSAKRKAGYLSSVPPDARTVMLREPCQAQPLIESVDQVYVVTSTMGFEALIAGKPVTCFGRPWYAGWGVTDDRQSMMRRDRTRTVQELAAAALIHYSRYLNPVTGQAGRIMDVVGWLKHQQSMAIAMHGPARTGRVIGVGMARWKAHQLKPMLGLHAECVKFVPDAAALGPLNLKEEDTVVVWGPIQGSDKRAIDPSVMAAPAPKVMHLEDGFIRSVGLGSDMIRPWSIVIDRRGLYFDATRPSDLEHLLNTTNFNDTELARAQGVRRLIVQHGMTKYNLESRVPVTWQSGGRLVVLVPGQVEDDASIRLGCTNIYTNIDLLRAVRTEHPAAYLVYKPHPDVLSRNRRGRVHTRDVLGLVDHIELHASLPDCLEACDHVHTMTSLTGFDALLRGKRVVTYGQPFYAGWGLTEDRCLDGTAFARRQRVLTLDQLVAGVLLRYPVYWDWDLKGYTSCEAVLHRLLQQRQTLEARGKLQALQRGYLRRQARQLKAWLEAQWRYE